MACQDEWQATPQSAKRSGCRTTSEYSNCIGMRIGNTLTSACAVNLPAGRRSRDCTATQRRAAGGSIRTVHSGIANERGGNARGHACRRARRHCADQRGPPPAARCRPECSQRGTGPSRPRARCRASVFCHGDALRSLACGNTGLRMVRHRKRVEAMTAPRPRSRQQPKQLDAGIFQAEISSFALRLAAEGKAAKTIRTYTEAVQWFAAARLPGQASWEQVGSQQWMTWLLDRYSNAYASNQYRALQQFFKWLAAEDELPDPMAGLQPPRDTAIIAVFKATGIRLAELAGMRYDPGDPRRSDIYLRQREITVRGKGGKDRIVRIG